MKIYPIVEGHAEVDAVPVLLRRLLAQSREEFMPPDRAYSETRDQPGMSELFDMCLAYRRNRSFRKFVKAFGEMLTQLHHPPRVWPPREWQIGQ